MENKNDAFGFEPTIKGFVTRPYDEISINEGEIDHAQYLVKDFVDKVLSDIDRYTSIAIYSAILAIEGGVVNPIHVTAISAFKKTENNGHITFFKYKDTPIFSRNCEYPNAANGLNLAIEFQFEKPGYGTYFHAQRAKEITGI